MNKIGFGFLRLPQKNTAEPASLDWEQIDRLVDEFIAKGGSYFDTAYTYLDGASEAAVKL